MKAAAGKGNAPAKILSVAGSRVNSGELERKYKYRVVRGERVIQDGLKLSAMKKIQ